MLHVMIRDDNLQLQIIKLSKFALTVYKVTWWPPKVKLSFLIAFCVPWWAQSTLNPKAALAIPSRDTDWLSTQACKGAGSPPVDLAELWAWTDNS